MQNILMRMRQASTFITMADSEFSDLSSDEEQLLRGIDPTTGSLRPVEGYQFEPKMTGPLPAARVSDTSDSVSSSDSEPALTRSRQTPGEWCRCGECRVDLLVREREFVCCRDVAATLRLAVNKG